MIYLHASLDHLVPWEDPTQNQLIVTYVYSLFLTHFLINNENLGILANKLSSPLVEKLALLNYIKSSAKYVPKKMDYWSVPLCHFHFTEREKRGAMELEPEVSISEI